MEAGTVDRSADLLCLSDKFFNFQFYLLSQFAHFFNFFFVRALEFSRVFKVPMNILYEKSRKNRTSLPGFFTHADHIMKNFPLFVEIKYFFCFITRDVDPDFFHGFNCKRIYRGGF